MQFYIDLPDVESHPEFLRAQQMADERIKSIQEMELKAKEAVAKAVINKFGYPHNIEIFTYQNSNKTDFVEVSNSILLASVEIKNDEVSFWVETNYFGDWYK